MIDPIQAIANRIAHQAGVNPPKVVIDPFCSDNMGANLAANRIDMCADFMQLHDRTVLIGVMAHEIGHLALGHIPEFQDISLARKQELDADRFATKLGYGKHLIAGFKQQRAIYGDQSNPDADHPTYSQRIAAIQGWMK